MNAREALHAAAACVRSEQDLEDEVWVDMRAGLCSFCQRPVAITDFLELASIVNGRLRHPDGRHERGGQGRTPVAYLTHQGCSPINGYWLSLDRLTDDELETEYGLLDHIEAKPWGCGVYFHALRLATDVANRLRATRSPRSRRPETARKDPSPSLRARVFERDSFRCRRCGHGPPEVKLVLDHVVAVALGGATAFDNLQSLCVTCNAGKGAREAQPHDLVVQTFEVPQ